MSQDQTMKSALAVVQHDIVQFEKLFEKIEATMEKLSEISSDTNKLLAVHIEADIQRFDRIDAALIDHKENDEKNFNKLFEDKKEKPNVFVTYQKLFVAILVLFGWILAHFVNAADIIKFLIKL